MSLKLFFSGHTMNHYLPLVALSLALLSACAGDLDTTTTSDQQTQELVADAGPDQIVDEGNRVNLSAGNSLNAVSYFWVQSGGSSAIDLNADDQSVVSFDAPLVDADSVYTFRLTVSDSAGNSASDEVSVTVIDSDPAVAVAEVNASEVNEGEQVQFSASSSQALGDATIVSYKWQQVGENSATTDLSNSSVFNLTAPNNLASDTILTFRLTVVDDGGTSDSDEVELLVNNSPTAVLTADQLDVNEGDTAKISAASSSDSDNGSVRNYFLRMVDIDGQESNLSNSDLAPEYSYTSSYVTTTSRVTFLLTVTDNDGASSETELTLGVLNNTANNKAPQAQISATNFNGELEENSDLDLSADSSSDSDGVIVEYLWEQMDSQGNSSELGTDANISYQPPNIEFDTNYTIVLTVTDDDGESSSTSLEILILNLDNEVPIPVASSNLNNGIANEGAEVILSAEQSYDDDQITTYLWQQIDSNGNQVSGSGALNITDYDKVNASFTAPAVDADTGYTFRLTLTDNNNSSASDEISILVNNSPTADAGTDQQVNEGAGIIDLVGTGSDTGSISYSWTQSGGTPSVIIDNSTSATASFEVPAVDADTALSFLLTVTDEYGGTGTSEVVININNLPTAAISSDFIIANEGSRVELDGSPSADTDADSISYSWIQTGGSPTVSIDANTSAIASFDAPEVDANTELTFQLTVSDDAGASSSATTVVQINNSPTVSASASAERLTEGDTLELSGSANDTDGDTIASYSWQQVNSDSSTTEIAITAEHTLTTTEVNADTSYTFRFTATDSQGASTSATDLIVTVNNSPTAIVPSDFEVNENTVDVALDGSESDDYGSTGIASYAWQQIDSSGAVINDGISINQADAAIASFTAPEVDTDTELSFQLTVTDDDGISASADLVVTINNYPTATATVNTTDLNEGDSVTLDGSGSDTDGSVTHSWHSVDNEGNIETPELTTDEDYEFTAPAVDADTSYTFRYTVTDSDGVSVSPSDIVLNVNNSPTAVAAAAAMVNEYAEGSLDGSGSSDEGGSVAFYQWQQIDSEGSALATSDPLYAGTIITDGSDITQASFTAPAVDQDETLYFQLTVTDNKGAQASATTATTINAAPVVSISASTTQITEGDSITLQGTGNDTTTATDALIYQWQQVNSASSTTDLSSEKDYTFASSSDLSADASHTFRFTVTDEHGASDSEDITINVDNTGPSASVASTTDTAADEGEPGVILDASASSGGITSYLWQQVDADDNLVEQGAVGIADPKSAETTFTAPSDLTTATSIYFRLTINDDDDDTPEVNATVSFNIVNSVLPSVTALDDFSADEGDTGVALDISASAGGISSYSWTQIDIGTNPAVTITHADPASATASFTAPSDLTEAITLTFQVSASDADTNSDSDTVAVTINNSESPTADVSATTVTTVTEGATNVSLDGSASSGGISSYLWQQTYSGSVVNQVSISDATSALASFAAPDDLTETITLSFNLTVEDDDGNSDSTAAEITVTNSAPTADLSNTASTADEGTSVSLDASASSGGISSYSWQQVDDQGNVISDGVTIDNADAEEASFTAPYLISSESISEVLTFKLTIDDDDSTTDPVSAITAITIKDVTTGNTAPTADAGTNQIGIAEGAAVELSGADSSDDDGVIVLYSWVQNDSSGIEIDITASDQPGASFTAPYLLAGATFTFTFDLTVTDDDGATSSAASVTVEVLDNNTNNSAPTIVINSATQQTVDEASTVSLEANVDDSDGYVATYSWLQTDSTGNTLIANTADNYIALTGADTTSASFTAPGILNDSITSNTYYFRLSVTDDDDDQGVSDLITVVVNNTYTSVEIAASAGVAPDFDQLSLSWDAIEGLTYNLYRSSESDCDLNDYTNCDKNALYASVDLSSGSQIDSGLEFFTSYYYWLEAQVDTEIVFSNSTPLEANTTGPVLNDTGVTQGGDYPSGFDSLGTGTACNGGYLIDDNGDVIADPDNHSGNSTFVAFEDEDCELGRDADTTLNDSNDGNAGFSFTRLNIDGSEYTGNGVYSEEPWACVLDNVTGLIWEVKTNDNTLRDRDEGFTWYDPDNETFTGTESSQDTADFVEYLNENTEVNSGNGLCGQSNWRLPTVQELVGISDFSTYEPVVDTSYFPNARTGAFEWSWTADLNSDTENYPNFAWLYNYETGSTRSGSNGLGATINSRYVRLVSSSAAVKSYFNDYSSDGGRYTDHGDGTVSDNRTGLMWMKCIYGQAHNSDDNSCGGTGAGAGGTWQEAFAKAAAINEGVGTFGYTDWRLPNMKELLSLVDLSSFQPPINQDIFPNTDGQSQWTSTLSAQDGGDAALAAGFGADPEFGVLGKTVTTTRVRLVRDDINTPRILTVTISDDNIINASDSSNLGAIPVSGTTIDVEASQILSLAINTNAYSTSAEIKADGSFTTTIDLSGITDGTYSVTADVSDTNGKAANQFTGSLLVDTIDPTITSVDVATGTHGIGASVALSITATNAETGLTLSSNSFNGQSLGAVTDNNNGTYTTSYTVVENDTDIADGDTVEVNLAFTDPAGNLGTATTSVVLSGANIDANRPTIASVSVEAGIHGIGDSVAITITAGSSETGLDLTSATFNGATLGSVNDKGDGTYTATYTVEEGNAHVADGGSVSVDLVFTDPAGNTGTAFESVTLDAGTSIDTTPPTQIISDIDINDDSGASDTDFLTKEPDQIISATLSAALESGDTLHGSVDSGSTWDEITVSGTSITWNSVTLSSGSIQLKVVDAAGNDGEVAEQAYILDTTAPTINTSGTDSTVDEGSSASLDSSNSSDSYGIASHSWTQVQSDGSAWADASTALDITNGNTATASVIAPGIANDTDGAQSFYFAVTITDKAGNTNTSSSSPLTLTVTNTYKTPTDLTATAVGAPNFNQISLSWSSDTSLTYSLYRSTDSNCDLTNYTSCTNPALYTDSTGITISGSSASVTDTDSSDSFQLFTSYYYWLGAQIGTQVVSLNSTPLEATNSGPVINDTGITGGGDYPSGFDNHNGLADGVEGAVCNGGYFTDQGAVVSDLTLYPDTSVLTFNPFTDEDCELGRDANTTLNDPSNGNAAFVFTKLDISGNVLEASATDWSCVLDHTTGLIWEVKATDGTWRDAGAAFTWYNPNHGQTKDANGNDIDFSGTESDADTQDFIDYVNGQSAVNDSYVNGSLGSGLCGSTDWRLPTVHEIKGLADYDAVAANGLGGYSSPSIDTDYFPHALASQYNWYWTSHLNVDPDVNPGGDGTVAGSSTSNYYAWAYNSAESRTRSGTGSTVGSTVRSNYVRLVSSSAAVASHFSDYSDDRYTDNGDGTISDARTGLMWMQCSYGQTYDGGDTNSDGIICEGSPTFGSWQQAFAWAADSNANVDYGYNDWRLPNIKELGSIVDFGSAIPAINQSIFPNTSTGSYWTSTPSKALDVDSNDDTQSASIWFHTGDHGLNKRTANLYLRLVRNLD